MPYIYCVSLAEFSVKLLSVLDNLSPGDFTAFLLAL